MTKVTIKTLIDSVCTKIYKLQQITDGLSNLIDQINPFGSINLLGVINLLENGSRTLEKWEDCVEEEAKTSAAILVLQEAYVKTKCELGLSLKNQYVEYTGLPD